MKKTLALVLALLPALAAAQTFPTVPSQTVIGRTAIGSGPAQAIPFSQLSAQFCSNFTLTLKGCVPPPGSTTGRYLSDDIATPWKAVPSQAVTAGSGVTLAGTCSGTAINCQVSATAATQYVLPSRAAAAGSDLSALSAIVALGYAAPGDSPPASFVKTSGRFLDTVVLTGNISNAGTGYTNGTYLYVPLTGSATGLTLYANVTVSGTVVTSVTILDINGRGAASLSSDVLTTNNANIGGTGSNFAYTISTMSSPLASFTDSAGNRWQYVTNGNYIDPRHFGCKFDFLGVDATATDDGACIQAALNFASIAKYPRQDLGGTLGSTRVVLPAGSAKICQGLIVPGATQLFGQGPFNSTIKVCDSGLSTSTHIITACDQNAHVACFGVQIGQLGINAFNATGAANTYAIYSNAAQQTRFLDNVNIYSGTRGCFKYEVGYGGAANVSSYDIFCTINTAAPNDAINVNAGTTLVNFKNVIIESGGAGFTGDGFHLEGGIITVDGYHTEGVTTGMNVHVTTATHSVVLMHATGGSNCTELVKLQAGNVLGNFAIFNAVKQGACTNLVTNGQPAGSNRTADAMPKDGLVSFNP